MSAPTGNENMNPKHSSWLDECNAGGSNMASNNEMGITSVVCVCVGGGGRVTYCGCSLTETNSRLTEGALIIRV